MGILCSTINRGSRIHTFFLTNFSFCQLYTKIEQFVAQTWLANQWDIVDRRFHTFIRVSMGAVDNFIFNVFSSFIYLFIYLFLQQRCLRRRRDREAPQPRGWWVACDPRPRNLIFYCVLKTHMQRSIDYRWLLSVATETSVTAPSSCWMRQDTIVRGSLFRVNLSRL